jgi:hypothetical protein
MVCRSVEGMLSECISCLEVEERNTYSSIRANTANRVRDNIRELIQFSAFI